MLGDGRWTNSAKRVSEEFESPRSMSTLSEVAEAESFTTPAHDGLYFYQLQRKPASIHLLPERKHGVLVTPITCLTQESAFLLVRNYVRAATGWSWPQFGISVARK